MTEKNDLIAWAIDLRERFPHWPYKKPKPGHEGFRLLDGPAPDFHRMTVEEFEALPPHIWMDVKKTLPPLEHPVLTVDAHADNIHTKAQLANFAYKAWLIEHTEEAEKAKKTEELLTELISYGVMKGVIRNDE